MATVSEPHFPDVTVQLTGENGNIFNLMGIVNRALRRAGHGDSVQDFTAAVTAATSYDDALQTIMTYVNVE
jgi:hypothetical protein